MGRWLIFANKEYVDKHWGILHTQTKLGNLGIAVQAATRVHADLYSKKGSHVISVYTYSFKDKADVKRVREALRRLGISWKISYIPYLDA